MKKDEFKDRLFDILNDTESLQISDIIVDDRNDRINVYLTDGSRFTIRCESCGNWFLLGI